MKRVVKRLLAAYEDRPYRITALLIAAWVLYGVVLLTPQAHFPRAVHSTSLADLYIGAASVSALVAGFAGVVVTFIYSAGGDRFRRFRVAAMPGLGSNWRTAILSSFAGATASFAAALVDVFIRGDIGWWVFTLGALLTCDAMARVIRQFFVMLRLVTADDVAQTRRQSSL